MRTKLIITIILVFIVMNFLYSINLLETKINKTITFIEYLSKEKIHFGLSKKVSELIEKHYDQELEEIKSGSTAVLSEKDKEFLVNFIELIQKPYKEHLEWAMEQVGEGDYLKAFGYLDYIKALSKKINKENENVKNFNYLVFMMEPLTGHIISEYPDEELDKIFSDVFDIVFPKASPKELLFTLLYLSRTWGGMSYKTVNQNIDCYIKTHGNVLKNDEIELFIKIKEGKKHTKKDSEIIERIRLTEEK